MVDHGLVEYLNALWKHKIFKEEDYVIRGNIFYNLFLDLLMIFMQWCKQWLKYVISGTAWIDYFSKCVVTPTSYFVEWTH